MRGKVFHLRFSSSLISGKECVDISVRLRNGEIKMGRHPALQRLTGLTGTSALPGEEGLCSAACTGPKASCTGPKVD